MKKGYSATLEKRIIKAVTSNGASGQKLLARLHDEHFHTEECREAYKRIKHLLIKRGVVIDWNDLIVDHSLDDLTRASLADFKKRVKLNDERIGALFNNLDNYRKHRAMAKLHNDMGQMLSADAFDIDEVTKDLTERFSQIKTAGTGMKITTIGKGDNAIDDVKSIMRGESIKYIRTGFNTYDSRNSGIPLASFMMVGSTSGGGKSVLLKTLAKNFALNGAKVCVIPLEMKNVAMLQRTLSEQSQVAMTKFQDPQKKMSASERKKVWKEYRRTSRRMAKAGGSLSYVSFEEDVDIHTVLLYAKPMEFDVIIIDYLGLLEGADGDDQPKALGRIGRVCARWSEINGPLVIAAVQLSADGLVRYSRALTEHAGTLWQWIYTPANAENKTIRISTPKSRMQESFDFNLHYDPHVMTMRDHTPEELEQFKGSGTANDNKKSDKSGKGKGKDYNNKHNRNKGQSRSTRDFSDLNDL